MIQRYDLLPMNIKMKDGLLLPVPGDELPMKVASRIQVVSTMIPKSELPMMVNKDSSMVPHAVPLELPMRGASIRVHVTTMIPGLELPMNHAVIPGASRILGETKYEMPGSGSKGTPCMPVFGAEATIHRIW
jgi:hypothetical protein